MRQATQTKAPRAKSHFFAQPLAFIIVVLMAAFAAPIPNPFDSYSVPLHKITNFDPAKIPDLGIDWRMEDTLRVTDKDPLNFADKYTLVEAGCGSGCLEFCFIDRTTGFVFPGMDFTMDFPQDYKGPRGLKYRRNSRLLMVYRADGFEYPVIVDYYLWDGARFTLSKTQEIEDKWKLVRSVIKPVHRKRVA